MITLIAAIGQKHEIGKGNKLLWNLPEDMKFFRNTTKEKTVVMGRKTFESIGKPLPKRKNIILTQNRNFSKEGVYIFHEPKNIIELAKKEDIYIMGGEQIYREFLPFADKMLLTHVEASFLEADTFFPKFEKENWKEKIITEQKKDEQNNYSFKIKEYRKK